MFSRQWYWSLGLLSSDITSLALAWTVATRLNRFYLPIPAELNWWVWLGLPSLFWVFAAVTLGFFVCGHLYHPANQGRNYIRTAQLVSLVYCISLVLTYFYDPKLDPPRSLFFTAWACSVSFIITGRLGITLLLRQIDHTIHQTIQIPVFLIAPAHRFSALAQVIQQRSHYHIAGAALSSMANAPATLQLILASGAREVLAESLPPADLASGLYWQLRRHGILLRLLPSSLEMLYRRGTPEVFAGLPTLRVEPPFLLLSGWDYRLKRCVDIVGALLGMIVLAPLFVGIAIAIRLSSPGAVFYRQERVGLHGKVFLIWKFRTMVTDADRLQPALEEHNNCTCRAMFKLKHDPRVTPVGRFLRRTSLDELPQLFNVLLGQMSLVGPRPLPLRDVIHFSEWHHIRHQVLPGITGLWQISGRSDITDVNHVVRLDLYYIDHWSLNLDLDILVETVRIVLFGNGAY
jgi:exopolysaccharide biosynthesis polyprenyl glycosylphosphotransferase